MDKNPDDILKTPRWKPWEALKDKKTLVAPEVGIDSIQETLSRPVSHLTVKQTYFIEME